MSVHYNSKIVTSGLVLALDAANVKSYPGSGNNWIDISTAGKTGTLISSPVYNANNSGSFIFNGVNYVSVAGSNTVTEATFIVWMKRSGTQQAYAGLIYSRVSFTGLDFDINGLNLGYNWNNDANAYNFASNLSPQDGTWCMCALSVSPTSATFYLCQSSGIRTATNTTSHASITISTVLVAQEISFRPFTGNISVAQMYNRALSAAEVSQNFNALRGRYGI